jgi:hypothetical protein
MGQPQKDNIFLFNVIIFDVKYNRNRVSGVTTHDGWISYKTTRHKTLDLSDHNKQDRQLPFLRRNKIKHGLD